MEEEKSFNNLEISYRNYVNEILIRRLRIMCFVISFFYLSFNIVDRFTYPSYANLFLKIRCAVDAFTLSIFLITSWEKAKKYALWIIDILMTVVMIGIASMVYLSDGSASRYYDGINLVFLTTGIINSFYYKNNLWIMSLWLVITEFAMLSNGKHFDALNFCSANAFMFTTSFLVVLMTKFYKDQHYSAYISQERLKQKEEALAALYSQADKLSKTDSLTEVSNRRSFSEMLNSKILSSESNESSFYLVIFDIDHFKEINDTYGHTFGDTALIKVVEVVKRNIRSNDFIGRFGGDEFVICLDHPTKESLLNRLNKIRDGVKNLQLTSNGQTVAISTSIGAARFNPGTGLTEKKLIEKADLQLIKIKSTTRGEISVSE